MQKPSSEFELGRSSNSAASKDSQLDDSLEELSSDDEDLEDEDLEEVVVSQLEDSEPDVEVSLSPELLVESEYSTEDVDEHSSSLELLVCVEASLGIFYKEIF